jgi:DNA primase
MLTNEIKEQIRARTDIVDLVSANVTLRKTGRRFVGLCPFHDERTPSFTVDRERGLFHCFGCGAGGDVFDFYMRTHGVTFPEAAEQLAKRAGIEFETSPDDRRRASEAEALYRALDGAARFFEGNLVHPETGRAARAYLDGRGVDGATAARLRLGYAPDGWDHLLRALRGRGHADAVLERAGLIQPRAGGGHYDAFRHRLMFPILDLQNRPIAFGGRILRESDTPKYLNSRENPVFQKGRTLYGLNWARDAIRRRGRAVVVEGYMDMLACHQFGVEEAVATLGTALTEDQMALLRRFSPSVVFVFDADEAGRRAAERALPLAEASGIEARAVALPDASDPDTFLRDRGRDAFEHALGQAQPLFAFGLALAMQRHASGSSEDKIRIVDAVLPLVAGVRHEVARAEYIAHLAQKLAISEDVLRAQLRSVRSAPAGAAPTAVPGASAGPAVRSAVRGAANARRVAERHLLHRMLDAPGDRARIAASLTPADFSDPAHRDLFGRLSDLDAELNQVRDSVSAETRAVLEQLLFEEQIPDVDVDRTIARIRDEQRKETLRGLVARLVDAERSGDIEQVRALQNEIQRVTSPENRAAGDTITS